MSIVDKIKEAALNQFIEVIEWLDDSQDTLVYRFPVARTGDQERRPVDRSRIAGGSFCIRGTGR